MATRRVVVAAMGRQSVSDLDADTFEWVSSGIIGAIAVDFGFELIGIPQPMAPNYDGGIEAKITTTSGGFAIQCKAYKRFSSEAKSVQASFATFLCEPQHNAVETYVWCSTNKRTVGNEAIATQALKAMSASATGNARTVDVRVLFADDLDRIIREHRPEYFSILSGLDPLRFADVAKLSEFEASRIITRLGPEDVPQLEFACPRTAELLDRVGESLKSGTVAVEGVQSFVDELRRRAHVIGRDAPIEAHAGVEKLTEILAPLLETREVLASELLPALVETQGSATSLLNGVVELVAALGGSAHEQADVDRKTQKQTRFDSALAYGRGIGVLLERITLLRVEVEAVLRRRLLITGPWGTGKSYQLATYTRKALAAEQPVLLLRARDFSRPDAPILSQPWRSRLRNENATAEQLVAMLDAIGRKAKAPLLIAIDGLNESSIRDIPAAVRRLGELVDRFPYVRLVVTDRQDRELNDDYQLPRFVHRPPDRVTMSRALEAALGASPGTPWHAALSNPLLASVGARVISAQRNAETEPTPILGRVALLSAWIELLVREVSTSRGVEKCTVQRIIDEISHAGGQIAIRALASAVALNTDVVDGVIRALIDEGLLEADPDTRDVVRFHWQGAGDLLRAHRAVTDKGISGVKAFIAAADETNRLTAIETIAELLPGLDPPAEILDLRVRGVTRSERELAFAWSLSARSDKTVSNRTLWHAKCLLRQGGEAAEVIVWSILVAPQRRELGPRWLSEQLRTCTLVERSRFWPTVLERLADGSPQGQEDLEEILTWYAKTLWTEVRGTDAPTFVEFLAWMSCARHWTLLRGYAVRSIVEILRHSPQAFGVALQQLHIVDDDHPRDALFAAAAGVVARWPDSESAEIVRGACHAALGRHPVPQSFRSLAEMHRAVNDDRPMHTFLQQTLPPLPRHRFGQVRGFMPDDDRAVFADGRDSRIADRFETDIWKTFGVKQKHLRTVLAAGTSNGFPLFEDSHGDSLFRGRWLARQHAEFPFGSRLWIRGRGAVKAGTPENAKVQFLINPEDEWAQPIDPSVPLALTIRGPDHIRTDTWWAIRSDAVIDGSGILHVEDHDGVGWVVIEGRFRMLEPGPTDHRNQPTMRVGIHNWALGGKDDGRPHPGSLRHEFVNVSGATLTGPPQGNQRRKYFRVRRFSDVFTARPPDGALNAHHDDAEVSPPTSTLLSLLGAKWTGEGIDCRDADGTLLVTDPAVGTAGPHAVLVRRDALERALYREQEVISVKVTVTDLNTRYSFSRKRRVNVTLEAASVERRSTTVDTPTHKAE